MALVWAIAFFGCGYLCIRKRETKPQNKLLNLGGAWLAMGTGTWQLLMVLSTRVGLFPEYAEAARNFEKPWPFVFAYGTGFLIAGALWLLLGPRDEFPCSDSSDP